jgi:hypothetical protein
VVHTLVHTLVYIDDSEQYGKGMAQVVGKGAGFPVITISLLIII